MLDIVYLFSFLFIFIKQTFHCFTCVILKVIGSIATAEAGLDLTVTMPSIQT